MAADRAADEKFMARAIELAAKARGRTAPNPLVGSVVVKNGRIIAEGYHKGTGLPHAEAEALAAAGSRARGSTVYVTLTPCNLEGQVPPCTLGLVGAGVKRVVVASNDPHPKADGALRRLRSAGIQVTTGVLADEAGRMNEVFLTWAATGTPFTVVKLAASLDGRIATRTGESRYITSEASLRRVHEWRDIYDAVCVGVGTVLADDPVLNVRLVKKPTGPDPSVIVIDSRLRTPPSAKFLKGKAQRKIIFTTSRASPAKRLALEKAGARVVEVTGRDGQVDLARAWRYLGLERITSVLVEGGPTLAWGFLDIGLADRFALFLAPKLIGGSTAPGVLGGRGVAKLAEAIALDDFTSERLGPDLLLTGDLDRRYLAR